MYRSPQKTHLQKTDRISDRHPEFWTQDPRIPITHSAHLFQSIEPSKGRNSKWKHLSQISVGSVGVSRIARDKDLPSTWFSCSSSHFCRSPQLAALAEQSGAKSSQLETKSTAKSVRETLDLQIVVFGGTHRTRRATRIPRVSKPAFYRPEQGQGIVEFLLSIGVLGLLVIPGMRLIALSYQSWDCLRSEFWRERLSIENESFRAGPQTAICRSLVRFPDLDHATRRTD